MNTDICLARDTALVLALAKKTDALVVLVSEETGKISVADHGKLHENLSRSELDAYLRKEFGVQAAEANAAMNIITVNWEYKLIAFALAVVLYFYTNDQIGIENTVVVGQIQVQDVDLPDGFAITNIQYEPDVESVRGVYMARRGLSSKSAMNLHPRIELAERIID